MIVLSVLAGCRRRPIEHASPPPPPSVASTPASTGRVSPAGLPPARDPCAPLRAEHAAALAKALTAAPKLDVAILPPTFGACVPSGRGAWAIVLAHARPDPTLYVGAPTSVGEGVRGRFHLVHRALDGTTLSVAPTVAADLAPGSDSFATGDRVRLSIDPPIAFDFDGDGQAELVLVVREDVYEQGVSTRGRVWTVKDGKLVLYDPARPYLVRGVRDVDGDGRPDLLWAGPWPTFRTVEPATPGLVLHALATGGFSRDDAVAARHASEGCRPAPTSLLPTTSPAKAALHAACARLAGRTADDVVAALEAAHLEGLAEGFVDLDDLRAVARTPPPLRLATAPSTKPSAAPSTEP